MQTVQYADLQISRLTLGTVQFGLDYGIANKSGQPSYETARDIIACACEHGVNCLDTAAAYGTSEEVIGKALRELGISDKVTIATKIHHLEPGLTASQADAAVEQCVTTSLKRLALDALPICVFHIESNFLEYADSLAKMKSRGLVKHIGSSTMTPEATLKIAGSGAAGAVQIPTSILDRRFVDSGLLDRAADHSVAVFVRSIYLQGLLLMPEPDIHPQLADVIPVRRNLSALASNAGISLAELAIRYLLGIPGITSLVVGVDTVDQMRENAALFSKGPLTPDLQLAVTQAVPDLPGSILAPTNWPKRS